jgi:hypothetical protein
MPKKSKFDKVEASELHKRVLHKFPRRPVEVAGIDSTWCADLVEMQEFSKQNKGIRYILTVIDVLSRYAWAIPLKDKKANTVLDAMTKIITKSGRQPKKLWVDKGSEFINKQFKKNFDEVYHTYSEFHAAPIERFNRTLKDIMWYKMTKHDSKEWVSRLPKLLQKYNSRKHSSIGMTPAEASKKENEKALLEIQTSWVEKVKKRSPKLKKGDVVRISRWKGVFEKGYTARWSHDLYEIVEVMKTKPITYQIKDLKTEEVIEGTFYEQELQKSKIKWSKEGVYLPEEFGEA